MVAILEYDGADHPEFRVPPSAVVNSFDPAADREPSSTLRWPVVLIHPRACPESSSVWKDGHVGSKSSRRYPYELKMRAVQMVADVRSDTVSEWEAMGRVADLLGVGTAETVRKWVRRAEIDADSRAGQTSEESEVLRKLRRENAELKRANAILKAASVFFAAELDRPSQ